MNNIQKLEKSLLGLSISNKKIFERDYSKRVDSNWFLSEDNKIIFESLELIHKSQDIKEFDIVAINNYIKKLVFSNYPKNRNTEKDWIEIVGDLMIEKGLESSSKFYYKQLKENYIKNIYSKKLVESIENIKKGDSFEEVSKELNSLGARIQDENNDIYGKRASEWFEEHFNEVMDSDGKPTGYKTGWDEFDSVLNGFQKKTVTTVAARPSMGKTAFGVNVAYNLAKNKTPVVFFSAEMDGADLSKRLLPFETNIGTRWNSDYDWLNKDKKRIELVKYGIKKIDKLDIIVDDHPALDIEDIEWKLPQYVRDGYKVFVIDYIQYVGVRKMMHKKEHEKISYIMKQLKTLSKKHNIAIVALAQIGRVFEQNSMGKNLRPSLSDIKGSGSIEENSDNIIAIHRPWFYLNKNNELDKSKRSNKIQNAEIFILKNRNGGVKDIKFLYYMDYNKFVEVENETKESNREAPVIPYEIYIKEVVNPKIELKIKEMKEETEGQQLPLDGMNSVLAVSKKR